MSLSQLLWTLLPAASSHGFDSAYPPNRSHALFPTYVTFAFSNATLDETMVKALRNYSDNVAAVAVADGQI